MRRFDLELTVGLFLIAGIVCLGYLSIRLGRMELLGTEGYEVYGLFSNTGGLKSGSAVAIAGVQVGRVREITLQDYQARVVMRLPTRVKVQEDSIAAIKTRGLIGEKYVEITPGASEEILGAGNRIRDTQPPVDIEQVISNYVFGKI